jgi:hypothetical protein
MWLSDYKPLANQIGAEDQGTRTYYKHFPIMFFLALLFFPPKPKLTLTISTF